MSVRIGMLSASHVHAPSYVACFQRDPNSEFIGVWDPDSAFLADFSDRYSCKPWSSADELHESVDAVVIAGTNMQHADLVEAAASKNLPILCEKPLAATSDQQERIEKAVSSSGVLLMTAFPCPFSPAFQSAQAKIAGGEIGRVLSVSATNHGKCPFGWFVEKDKSGGGAMIDHVVHVSDLLRRVLSEEPSRVHAVTGSNMYGKSWDDTAMLTIDYPSGVFATLDSSWSRPKSYKTWGDVTLTIIGEKGVVELDLFPQSVDWFSEETGSHAQLGYGSDLDRMMVAEFVRCVQDGGTPMVTMQDGLAASKLAMAGYESSETGQPVAVG